MVKVPPWPAPQLGSCASSGRAWRRLAARHSQEEAGPLSAQPLPRMLEPAASTAADSTAFDHPGEWRAARRLHLSHVGRGPGRAGDEHVHDPRQARLKAALLSPGTPLARRTAGVVPRVEATRISRSISPSHLYLSISRQLDYPEIVIPAHESSEGM